MLDQAEINLGQLLSWLGMTTGIVLMAVNAIIGPSPALGPIGVAVIVVTCAHSVRRSVVTHDAALREAFEHGREHGKLQKVQQLR